MQAAGEYPYACTPVTESLDGGPAVAQTFTMRYLLTACVLFLGCSQQQPAEHPAAVAFRELAEHEAAKDYGYLWDHFSRAERTAELDVANATARISNITSEVSDDNLTPKLLKLRRMSKLKGRALWLEYRAMGDEPKFTGREVVSVDEAGLLTLRVKRADGDLEEKARMVQEDGQWVYDGTPNLMETLLER